jgi:ribulose-5-phosphate 4-epimerase/fuculose-1-phosphate aldolase
MLVREATIEHSEFTRAEWEQRVDLAAAHRIAHQQGFSEGIFNHLTAVVPGQTDYILCLPFGLHWSEATASGLLTVDPSGNILRGRGEIERSNFCIHFPIHRMRPDTQCVFHTHMPFAAALTRLEDSQLLPIGQTESSLIGDMAYDYHYTGFACDPSEGERLGRILGDKWILSMGNHGVLVLGRSVAEAYNRLYYLERACQVQLYAMWTQQKLRHIPADIMALTYETYGKVPRYGNRQHYDLHFEALKRLLEGPPKTSFDD